MQQIKKFDSEYWLQIIRPKHLFPENIPSHISAPVYWILVQDESCCISHWASFLLFYIQKNVCTLFHWCFWGSICARHFALVLWHTLLYRGNGNIALKDTRVTMFHERYLLASRCIVAVLNDNPMTAIRPSKYSNHILPLWQHIQLLQYLMHGIVLNP